MVEAIAESIINFLFLSRFSQFHLFNIPIDPPSNHYPKYSDKELSSLTADLPYGTTDPPLKLDTPYDQRKNSIENKTLRFGVASTMEEKYYPFSVKGSAWLYIKLRKTRVEIMWLHNGIGSSTTILTGANVIDIVPSKYSIYGRIHV